MFGMLALKVRYPIVVAMLAPHLLGLLAMQSDLGQSGWCCLADKIALDFPQNLACGGNRSTCA